MTSSLPIGTTTAQVQIENRRRHLPAVDDW